MPGKCNCAGASCGCSIVAGTGTKVSGTGTASDPFVVSSDLTTLAIADSFAVSSSTTIEFGKSGTGAPGSPVVITGQVVLRSPDQTRWTLSVANGGVLSAIPAGPSPTGATNAGGGTTVVANDILYFDGTKWDTRSTTQTHAIWSSLGYTGVPLPPNFKKGDTWLCEAT